MRLFRMCIEGCVFFASFVSSYAEESKSKNAPQGEEKTAKTKTLATGAKLFQGKEPFAGMNVYLVGLHPMKDHPDHQMVAHHFCRQVNEDFAQCILFDGNSEESNLNGIEYIISAKLFNELPAEEKEFWHPHNYEILSGQLFGPGLPSAAEKELMRSKMNSYGKTWHVWNTGHHGLNDAQKLPLGEPKLGWSFNRDGEAIPGLVGSVEKEMNVDTSEKRAQRQDLVPIAEPQAGVDAIKNKFRAGTKDIPGVVPLKGND